MPPAGIPPQGMMLAEVMEEESKVAATTNAADARYFFDETKLQALQKESPWTKEAKYFNKVAISPSAIMKMVCYAGVFIVCCCVCFVPFVFV